MYRSGLRVFEKAVGRLRIPTQCRVCRSWQLQVFCAVCIRQFAAPRRRCSSCALPLGEDEPGARTRCQACRLRPPPQSACWAAIDYAFPWSGSIAAFKFGGEPGLAAPLAALLRDTPGVPDTLARIDLAVPMPLSRERLAARGYNQAHEIARRLLPGRVRTDLLLRLRHTGAQSERSLRERWRNVAGAFAVDPLRVSLVRGRHLALVDDVMTSGASAAACCAALQSAGAASVTVFVLARTPQPDSD